MDDFEYMELRIQIEDLEDEVDKQSEILNTLFHNCNTIFESCKLLDVRIKALEERDEWRANLKTN